jgi:hypothetical protein
MKYAVEMGSGAMIYKSSFVNIGSGISKLIRGDTDSKVISEAYFYFFQNKKSRLKVYCCTYA